MHFAFKADIKVDVWQILRKNENFFKFIFLCFLESLTSVAIELALFGWNLAQKVTIIGVAKCLLPLATEKLCC